MKTKNLGFAEKVQDVGGSLVAIKGSEIPLEGKTYIFKENIQQFEKPLLEKYGLKKEDIDKLVEKSLAKAPVNKKK